MSTIIETKPHALTHEAVASAMNLPDGDCIVADISDELYREIVVIGTGHVYRISNPVSLVIRKGGFTHRVVDVEGVVHCYPAPHTALTVLRWKAKSGLPPVKF